MFTIKNFPETKKKIRKEYPGKSNQGLRKKIQNFAVSQANQYDSDKPYVTNFQIIAEQTAFSFPSIEKRVLKEIQAIFEKELEIALS